jgi:acyl carrier protein phosphodiesterase
MNFLAHTYLSGDNSLIRIGNFMGDWIKGNEFKKYPDDIQKGVLIHRSIDYYTDNHPIVKQSKNRFNEKYHKYSGILIDVYYDHFLAREWENFSSVPYPEYLLKLKEDLMKDMVHFSDEIQEFIPRFMNYGWMASYATIDGIQKVLTGMVKHTSLPDKTDDALEIFEMYYNDFRQEFYDYFPQLVDYIEENFQVSVKHQMVSK